MSGCDTTGRSHGEPEVNVNVLIDAASEYQNPYGSARTLTTLKQTHKCTVKVGYFRKTAFSTFRDKYFIKTSQ